MLGSELDKTDAYPLANTQILYYFGFRKPFWTT